MELILKTIANLFNLSTDTALEMAERRSGLKGSEAVEWLANELETNVAARGEINAELAKLAVSDVQDARNNQHDAVDRLSYIVMLASPLLIGALIGMLIYVEFQDLPPSVVVPLATVIGGALNQLYQERQQVMNYMFGSSLGTKKPSK